MSSAQPSVCTCFQRMDALLGRCSCRHPFRPRWEPAGRSVFCSVAFVLRAFGAAFGCLGRPVRRRPHFLSELGLPVGQQRCGKDPVGSVTLVLPELSVSSRNLPSATQQRAESRARRQASAAQRSPLPPICDFSGGAGRCGKSKRHHGGWRRREPSRPCP